MHATEGPILEGRPYYFKLKNEMIITAKDFNIIATANTKGKGSDDGRYIPWADCNTDTTFARLSSTRLAADAETCHKLSTWGMAKRLNVLQCCFGLLAADAPQPQPHGLPAVAAARVCDIRTH